MLCSTNTIQSFLDTLEIKQDHNVFKTYPNTLFKHSIYYFKHQFLYVLKQKYFQPLNLGLKNANEIIHKHFIFEINPLFITFSKFPYQMYVCGHCNEIFLQPGSYMAHFLEKYCKINHERSTFFVSNKNTSVKLQNIQVQLILTKQEVNILKKSRYRENSLFLTKFQTILKSQTQHKVKYHCGECKKTPVSLYMFIIHCFGHCYSFRHKDTSHNIIIHQSNTSIQELKQNISNVYLNYNILALYKNSYIKIQRNVDYNLGKGNFCQNCHIKLINNEDFLYHSFFQCKLPPNNKSSHVLMRKMTPRYKLLQSHGQILEVQNQPRCKNNQKVSILTISQQKKQNIGQNKMRNKQITQKIVKRNNRIVIHQHPYFIKSKNNAFCQFNSRKTKDNLIYYQINQLYKDFKNELKDIIFCGQCWSYFSDLSIYFAHSKIFYCALNHPYNSHYFFSSITNQPIQINKINDKIDNESINIMFNNNNFYDPVRLFRCYQLIDKQTGKYGTYKLNNKKGICGNCQVEINNSVNYIRHIIKTCRCPNHEDNNYQFIIKESLLQRDEIRNMVIKIIYSIKIINYSSQKIFKIIQNNDFKQVSQNKRINEQYYCGECQLYFMNQYQFVYHCLTICQQFQCKYSSHFIIKENFKQFNDPLKIVSSQNKNNRILKLNHNKKQKRNKFQKQSNPSNSNQFQSQTQKSQQSLSKNSQNNQHSKYIQNQFQNDQNKQKVQQQFNNNQNDQYPQLYPNVDFKANSQQQFYCGKCDLSFKKVQMFLDHLQYCANFEYPNSSHYFITKNRMNQIIKQTVFSNSNYKFNCEQQFPSYKENTKQIACGCGASNIFGLPFHLMKNHQWIYPQGTSHIIIRVRLLKLSSTVHVCLPVNPNPQNHNDIFICPCNPFKKLPYTVFVNHVIKRHEGKTPIFYMKRNDSLKENQN